MKKVFWFTGLPCSGKTTLALTLVRELIRLGEKPVHLDGDLIRALIGATGFSREDRDRHIRYMAGLSRILIENGHHVVASFVSPFQKTRDEVKEICGRMIEIYLSTPIKVCEKRDVKGMYAKARKGEIKNFTGIDSPYEVPSNPFITLDTTTLTIAACTRRIITWTGIIPDHRDGSHQAGNSPHSA